jgi:hypothetical protein
MQNSSLSYQLSDFLYDDQFGNDNITFGGNVESAYTGTLIMN